MVAKQAVAELSRWVQGQLLQMLFCHVQSLPAHLSK